MFRKFLSVAILAVSLAVPGLARADSGQDMDMAAKPSVVAGHHHHGRRGHEGRRGRRGEKGKRGQKNRRNRRHHGRRSVI